MTELESKIIELAKLSEWAATEILRLRAQVAEGRELLQEAREEWIEDYECDGKPNDLGSRIDAYLVRTATP